MHSLRKAIHVLSFVLLALAAPLSVHAQYTVLGWGLNSYGQIGNGTTVNTATPGYASGLSNVARASAGGAHSLTLMSDGTVWACGYNSNGRLGNGTTTNSNVPVKVPGLSGVVGVSAGGSHSLAVKRDGTVWAWGKNVAGQLGNGSTTDSYTPIPVPGLPIIAGVSAGDIHSLAVDSNGVVWAWGDNTYGQLGNGTTVSSFVPVTVPGLSGIVGVAAGETFSLAVKSDGTVWAWGQNGVGQLGNGTTTGSNMPVQVTGLSGVVGISAGYDHVLAVTSDGTAWAWGSNAFGQLGNGTMTNSNVPVPVSGISGTVAVAAGLYFSVAVKSDGTASAWGINEFGQLGNGTTTNSNVPVGVTGSGFVGVVAGGYGGMMLHRNAVTAWSWGYNGWGQLGNGTTGNGSIKNASSVPVQVLGPAGVGFLMGVLGVAAAYNHSVAVLSDGTTWCWGSDSSADLGIGIPAVDSLVPVQALVPLSVAVAAANYHNLALNNDGTVSAWGLNLSGQIGNGSYQTPQVPVQALGLNGVVGIAAGQAFSLAVKNDGTVWAWGDNGYGTLGIGSSGPNSTSNVPVQVLGPMGIGVLTGAVAVAGGAHHSLALMSNGTVWAWGDNTVGQLGNGISGTGTGSSVPVQVMGLSNVVAVTAGYNHSLAIKSDGTLWAWGLNTMGQIGNGTTTSSAFPVTTPVQVIGLSGVVSVAGGVQHSLAVQRDGTAWAWGENVFGELGNNTRGSNAGSNAPVQVSSAGHPEGFLTVSGGEEFSLATVSEFAPPVANGQAVTTVLGTPVAMTLAASAANPSGIGTYTIVTGPAQGTLSGAAPNLIYTPNPGYVGADSFAFTANDGTFDSNLATVSLTVTTPPATDVSSLVQVSSSGLVYNRSTKLFSGTITLNNISHQTLTGPLQVVLNALPTAVTLTNAAGTHNGAPYLTSNVATLAPGATVVLTVRFSDPSGARIGYSVTTYSGSF